MKYTENISPRYLQRDGDGAAHVLPDTVVSARVLGPQILDLERVVSHVNKVGAVHQDPILVQGIIEG